MSVKYFTLPPFTDADCDKFIRQVTGMVAAETYEHERRLTRAAIKKGLQLAATIILQDCLDTKHAGIDGMACGRCMTCVTMVRDAMRRVDGQSK